MTNGQGLAVGCGTSGLEQALPLDGSAGRSWRHGRVEQPRAAAPHRPRAQPGVLPRHPRAGHLPRVRQRAGPGNGVLPGWRVPGGVGSRCDAAGTGHGVVAAGARAGRDATGAWRAWHADPAGAEAGAVGAAGDVDRRPRWGAHLPRGGAAGPSAAPPRLTALRSSMACRSGGVRFPDGLSDLPEAMTGWALWLLDRPAMGEMVADRPMGTRHHRR